MKTKTLLFLTILFLLTSCGSASNKTVNGNRKVVTKNISISDYDEIAVAGSVDFEYVQSNKKPSLEITIDENMLQYMKIEVKNGKLVVEPKRVKENGSYNLNPTVCKIKTNSRNLKSVKSAGSGHLKVASKLNFKKLNVDMAGSGRIVFEHSMKGDEMKVNMAGSGKVIMDNISAKSLVCSMAGSGEIRANGDMQRSAYDIAGSGSIRVGGSARETSYNIAGSGKISAFDSKVKQVKASIVGSGSIETYVTDKLEASTINGSGKISYKGNPSVKSDARRSNSIRQVN
ncbi:DUF2807 domain-containing protein [Parabacteroides sp. OttesenSCG-928-G21]|nr:DUF2807 domain-containing protein [Parabacteroides sp. OttesenSCG-928-G21]